tara:strand:- start:689 stop:979 length:291 start_codon:yes stop_codon:yes gene_type:complete
MSLLNYPCCFYQDETRIFYMYDLFGLNKDDIIIKVVDNVLTVADQREIHNSSKHISTSLSLPNNINIDDNKVTYTNGVLNISFLKTGEKTKFLYIE